MDLRLRVRSVDEATLMEIGGEIDLHSAPQLRAALLKITEAPLPRLVVDLSDVIFIDSTGIGVLVGALKRAREGGGGLHFCGIQTRVRRVFEITGLSRILPLYDSREAALAPWSAAPEPVMPPATVAAPIGGIGEARHE